MLPKINPTTTIAWKKLEEHSKIMKRKKIKELFEEDKERFEKFSIKDEELVIDYSKNLINEKTLKILFELAEDVKLKDAINKMFCGEKINETENRAVLHTILRMTDAETNEEIDKNICNEIKRSLNKIKEFSEKILNGEWKGYTNKPIKTIVNVGIGGSSLGIEFLKDALEDYKKDIDLYLITSADPHIFKILEKLDYESTLFVISSKSFSTIETIENTKVIIKWLVEKYKNNSDKYKLNLEEIFEKHFIAITANKKKANELGIKNVIEFWDFVNGRCSIWGPIGFPIACYIGFDNFLEFLKGAREMDKNFKNNPFEKNICVILGLLDVYYNNFFNCQAKCIVCYNAKLKKFYKYIQQLWMESNGKNVDREGNFINYNTAGIVFGGAGTDVQHSFFQLLHQGTPFILSDFIGVASPFPTKIKNEKNEILRLNEILISNFFGQTEALMKGKTKEELIKEGVDEKILPYKIFKGNKPTNLILLKNLTPKTIGKLIALYEHRIFVEGIVENIYSFDQFGVELGKELSKDILKKIREDKINPEDLSTIGLLKIYKEWKK